MGPWPWAGAQTTRHSLMGERGTWPEAAGGRPGGRSWLDNLLTSPATVDGTDESGRWRLGEVQTSHTNPPAHRSSQAVAGGRIGRGGNALTLTGVTGKGTMPSLLHFVLSLKILFIYS